MMLQSLQFFAATKCDDLGAHSVKRDDHKAAFLSKNNLNGIYGMTHFGGRRHKLKETHGTLTVVLSGGREEGGLAVCLGFF